MIGNIEATLILIMMDFDQIEMFSLSRWEGWMYPVICEAFHLEKWRKIYQIHLGRWTKIYQTFAYVQDLFWRNGLVELEDGGCWSILKRFRPGPLIKKVGLIRPQALSVEWWLIRTSMQDSFGGGYFKNAFILNFYRWFRGKATLGVVAPNSPEPPETWNLMIFFMNLTKRPKIIWENFCTMIPSSLWFFSSYGTPYSSICDLNDEEPTDANGVLQVVVAVSLAAAAGGCWSGGSRGEAKSRCDPFFGRTK